MEECALCHAADRAIACMILSRVDPRRFWQLRKYRWVHKLMETTKCMMQMFIEDEVLGAIYKHNATISMSVQDSAACAG